MSTEKHLLNWLFLLLLVVGVIVINQQNIQSGVIEHIDFTLILLLKDNLDMMDVYSIHLILKYLN